MIFPVSFTLLGILLLVLVGLLMILVPGGPIENRDFSHMPRVAFWGFNIFLTTLGVATFVAAYGAFIENAFIPRIAIGIAAAYLVVYLLDLMKIFPKSLTPMSPQLRRVEVLDSIVAIAVIITAISLL